MQKTIFLIQKMDCPSEEQMIRMKLEPVEQISTLAFDIPNRNLTVYHSEAAEEILAVLDVLNFDTSIVETIQTAETGQETDRDAERKLLFQVLAINAFFFVLESLTGFLSNSMGLVADGLDMLADSLVYGLALFAIGGSAIRKQNVARVSGYFQLLLAIMGLVEVIRRFLGFGETPVFGTMIVISVLALVGNAISLYILQKSKSQEAHMQASMIFTSNDVIVNLGVILAGVLVFVTGSRIPDLIIGAFVFLLVTRGAFRILSLSK